MKKGLMVMTLLVLVLPLVAAYDTEIELKTIQSGDVTLRVLNQDTGKKLPGGEFFIKADQNGMATATYTGPELLVKLSIIVEGVTFKEVPIIFFKNIQTNKHVFIDLTNAEPSPVLTDLTPPEPEEIEEVVEEIEEPEEETEDAVEPIEEQEETTEERTQGTFSITGNVIANAVTPGSRTFYYMIGGILLALIVVITLFFMHNHAARQQIKESIGLGREMTQEERDEIQDAEEKIKAAQAEINEIKNKSKIEEAERQLKKDQEELEKLKRG